MVEDEGVFVVAGGEVASDSVAFFVRVGVEAWLVVVVRSVCSGIVCRIFDAQRRWLIR